MSIKRNAVFSIALSISNVIFPFVTTPYISRVLGVESIGVVNFAISYAAYFMLFAMLGVPTYGIRVIAKQQSSANSEDRDRVFWELFALMTICAFVVSLLYVGSVFIVPQLYEQRKFLLIAGLTVYLASFNIEWYFGGREQFKWITIRSLMIKLVMLCSLFVFVKDENDTIVYMWLLVGSTLLNHIWNWIYFLRLNVKHVAFKTLKFRYHFKPLMLLFASSVAISIYTMLDTIMLGFISTYEEVGYYTSAMKISRVVMPLVTAMSPVIVARVSILKEQNDISKIKFILQESFNYVYTLAVPMTIGLIVIAPRFVPFFFGEEFLSTIIPLQLVSLLILIIGINNIYGSQLVQAMGYDREFLNVILWGTCVNLILNTLLIKSYGAVGAAFASVIAECLVLILMVYYSTKIVKLNYSFSFLTQPIIASVPIIIISYIINICNVSNLLYLSIVIIMSIVFYFIIMIWGLKNQTMTDIFDKIVSKLKLS